MSQEYSNLNIIKASAGSGKTYRITKEYIKKLISNPKEYRHILAVTFTNKATAEMKSRILENLLEIAKYKTNDKTSNLEYISELARELNVSTSLVQENAKLALTEILHHYSYFSVSTIDHFFQNIIRALTHELDLNGGFKLEINNDNIIDLAVNKFMLELANSPEDMTIVVDFIDHKIENDKKWNVSFDLKQFAKQIFKENIRKHFIVKKETYKQGLYLSIRTELKQNINSYISYIKEFGSRLYAYIDENDLYDYLPQKSRNKLFSLGKKLKTLNLKKIYDLLSEVEDKGTELFKDEISFEHEKKLVEFINQIDDIKNKHCKYLVDKAIYDNIFNYFLIQSLFNKISEVTSEQNIFLLSDASILLDVFTHDSDAPFIYERIGHRYSTFMIDEFQDTSGLQWNNFKPFIEEALANGENDSFLVGDVKQAIYRWRNGDWSLLHKTVAEQITQTKLFELKENWRSSINIVKFNNNLFKYLALSFDNICDAEGEIVSMYNDIEQQVPDKVKESHNNGYVKLLKLDKTQDDLVLPEVKEYITKLVENHNVSISEICILVRNNSDIPKIAEALLPEYSVLSLEALTLGNSNVAKFIMAVINYIVEPAFIHEIAIATRLADALNFNINDSFFNDNYKTIIPKEFYERVEELKNIGPVEFLGILNEIFKFTSLFSNEQIFFTKFYNEIKKNATQEYATYLAIIDWWNKDGKTINVSITESSEPAIPIMSIHKSKGLQFKHVILPYVNWIWSKVNRDTLWIKSEELNFAKLPNDILPLNISKDSGHGLLEPIYKSELIAQAIDSLNVLYVANTRAEKSLFIVISKIQQDRISWVIDRLLDSWLSSLKDVPYCLDDNIIEIGSLKQQYNKVQEESCNVLKTIQLSGMESVAIKHNVTAFLSGKDIFTDSTSDEGSLLHKIFEKIIKVEDVQKAIDVQKNAGNISTHQAKSIYSKILEWISDENIKKWFDGTAIVKTEVAIISSNSETKRIDRLMYFDNCIVVLDYKFGKNVLPQHEKQVRNYCHLLSQINSIIVKGYIWYPILNKIVEV